MLQKATVFVAKRDGILSQNATFFVARRDKILLQNATKPKNSVAKCDTYLD
jgi:hypothetical protein